MSKLFVGFPVALYEILLYNVAMKKTSQISILIRLLVLLLSFTYSLAITFMRFGGYITLINWYTVVASNLLLISFIPTFLEMLPKKLSIPFIITTLACIFIFTTFNFVYKIYFCVIACILFVGVLVAITLLLIKSKKNEYLIEKTKLDYLLEQPKLKPYLRYNMFANVIPLLAIMGLLFFNIRNTDNFRYIYWGVFSGVSVLIFIIKFFYGKKYFERKIYEVIIEISFTLISSFLLLLFSMKTYIFDYGMGHTITLCGCMYLLYSLFDRKKFEEKLLDIEKTL